MKKQLVVVGGGPAGLAAALSAYDSGVKDIVILEREPRLGGILNQCIHNGFGLHTFNEELTGPEYAERYISQVEERKIPYLLDTTVLNVSRDKKVTYINKEQGQVTVKADAVILACGCRERPRGAIGIAGGRVAGIYSAGTAQKFVNIDGFMPGKEVVILGSGDIGLIMARRMTFEGAKVKAVIELMPYSSGLNRNIVQCLNDFDIPLLLSHTVTRINGKDGRVTSVEVCEVDEKLSPIYETVRTINCDTLLLSVGLLPENELARGADVGICPVTGGAEVDDDFMTDIDGVFECGNVLHVHDLVDYVSEESGAAGRAAARYINGEINGGKEYVTVKTFNGVRYTVPQKISKSHKDELILRMRVNNVYKKANLVVKDDKDETVFSKFRQIVTPGEMETVVLSADTVEKIKESAYISVGLEGKV